jgi:NDP-sugar pyrophosphorylase family protein
MFVNPRKSESALKAMIFAAGLGSRLQGITKNKPKALVELNGKPLLQLCIEKLKRSGVEYMVVNVHHFAGEIVNFLKLNNNFGVQIEISDESDELLDTGGGLVKAATFLNDGESFWAVNTDVFSNIDLHSMRTHHLASGALATLAVRKRETSRYFLFDEFMNLCGWENIKTGERIESRKAKSVKALAFSGIQIIRPEFFSLCPPKDKFSITKSWIELSGQHNIKAYCHDTDYWFDLGTPEMLALAEDFTRNNNLSV